MGDDPAQVSFADRTSCAVIKPPQDFLAGIADSEPLFGPGGKLIVIAVILAAAIGIIWWLKK